MRVSSVALLVDGHHINHNDDDDDDADVYDDILMASTTLRDTSSGDNRCLSSSL